MKRAFVELGESSGEQRRQEAQERWPGWPGYNVFRFIVPTSNVGRIIGHQGETVKRICNETLASVNVFQTSGVRFPDRIVRISGQDDPDKEYSRAMLAAVRVFKLITDFPTSEDVSIGPASYMVPMCCIRLLVHNDQLDYLTGRHEDALKALQENSNVYIMISSVGAVMPYYAMEDEKVIEIEGESSKVLRALESVLRQLRIFLVDKEVVPMFENMYHEAASRFLSANALNDRSYSIIHSGPFEPFVGSESSSMPSNWNCAPYSGSESELPIDTAYPMVPQRIQTMEVALQVAERITGDGGVHMNYICRTSRALTNARQSSHFADMATIQIKGTISQIQIAQHLIEDFIDYYRVPPTTSYNARPDIGSNQYS